MCCRSRRRASYRWDCLFLIAATRMVSGGQCQMKSRGKQENSYTADDLAGSPSLGGAEVELQMSDHWQRVQIRWLTCSQQDLPLSCHRHHFSCKTENVDPDGSNFIHQQDHQTNTNQLFHQQPHVYLSWRHLLHVWHLMWLDSDAFFLYTCLPVVSGIHKIDFSSWHVECALNLLPLLANQVFSAVTGEQVASLSVSEEHVPETLNRGQKHELSADHRLFWAVIIQ